MMSSIFPKSIPGIGLRCFRIYSAININDKSNKIVKMFNSNSMMNNNNLNYSNQRMVNTFSKSDTNVDEKEFFLPTPREIHNRLSEYVIGNDHAKRILSVTCHNHLQKVKYSKILEAEYLKVYEDSKEDETKIIKRPNSSIVNINKKINEKFSIPPAHCLLTGPSGCGKTLLARTLADYLKVPFVRVDCCSLTQSGYVGSDVESIIYRLIQASNGNISQASQGIVYLDEIDKLRTRIDPGSPGQHRDVAGLGVQEALLRLLEPNNISLPGISGMGGSIDFKTDNLLFVGGGAFVGLDEVKVKRLAKSLGRKASRSAKKKNQIDNIDIKTLTSYQDLLEFGMIPELLGRFSTVINLNPLTVEELASILKDTSGSSNLLSQYKTLFKFHGITLDFTERAINEIARVAFVNITGARSLRAILEEILLDEMYIAPEIDSKLKKIVDFDEKTKSFVVLLSKE